ncbi:hypothetical protein GJ744_011134 [Endocarpon pusillum]|uniref:UBA domain-containing protein n=1 Tax=Endocarpon pusillum TaxID=364733 RepID=A0A8H7E3L8_9EURO|nr:hypothetical protein GJ744_011134 [Endocarpon pusillum]
MPATSTALAAGLAITTTTTTTLTAADVEAANTLLQMANSSNQPPVGGSGSIVTTTQQDPPVKQEPESELSSAPESPAESRPESYPESEPGNPDESVQADTTRWNAIIPHASRSVPIGNIIARTPGRTRQSISTPASNPRTVSLRQQGSRVWGMRQLLGEPVGITDGDLRHALVASGWDLGTALRRMNDVLNQARRRHRTNAPGRSPAEQQRDRLLGADSVHHNRRLGIDFLYTRLVQVVRADQVDMLTTLTLGQLLADHRFDVDEAVHAFLERIQSKEETEHHQRLDRRLRMINPNQMHLDQRIARFMEIAGSDDWYAVRALLATHGYDMLRAMDHWMRNGLASAPIPPSELTRTTFRTPRRPHTDTEDLWPHPRPLAGRLDNIDEDDLADAAMDYDDTSNPERNGWMVRYPRSEARVGVNIPTRRRCDYVRRGEFTTAEVTRAETVRGSGIRYPFDYNESNHVRHLNDTASQWFRRTTGELSKKRGMFYQNEENDWIWWWHNERLWELIEQHPELLDATSLEDWERLGIKWPIKIDKNQMTIDFNNRWAGTMNADGEERSAREMRSLDAQRRRIIAICEDFGLPYSPAHPPGPAKKPPQPPQYSPSGSSDEDGDDGNDSDDDDQPPRKKRKPAAKKSGKKDKKGKKKAADVNDQEEYGSLSDNDDGGDSSGDDQPVKTTPKGMKKGGTSTKLKRGDDEEGEYEDSDHDEANPGASGGKKAVQCIFQRCNGGGGGGERSIIT